MGMTRKFLSTFTMGLIDFKSDKERIATSTRKTKQAAHKGNRLTRQQNALLAEQHELLSDTPRGPAPGDMKKARGHVDMWGRYKPNK